MHSKPTAIFLDGLFLGELNRNLFALSTSLYWNTICEHVTEMHDEAQEEQSAQQLLPWTRDRLQRNFGKIFPLQSMLFEHIDKVNNSIGRQADSTTSPSDDILLPFSIEISPPDGGQLPEPLVSSIFRFSREKRDRSSLNQAATVGDEASVGDSGERRDPGPTKRPQQTRFFIALTLSSALEVAQRVPSLDQHLYEIIREGLPCKLYFDVERDGDYIPPQCTYPHSPQRTSFPAAASSVLEESGIAVNSSSRTPFPRLCRMCCEVKPDNSVTEQVLLGELSLFLREARPELLLDLMSDAEVTVLKSITVKGNSNVPPASLTMGSHGSLPSAKKEKFSLHIIIDFKSSCFANNIQAGKLVCDFVEWLFAKVCRDESGRLHSALFFHAEPSRVEAPTSSNGPIYMPLRCVIDTAVYSKNRMFRCLGSTKLGKAGLLVPAASEGSWNIGDVFRKSLISFPSRAASGERRVIFLTNLATSARPGGERTFVADTTISSAATANAKMGPSPFPLLDAFVEQILAGLPTQSLGYVYRYLFYAESHVVYTIDGSRFCRNVQREHKSNKVYYICCLISHTWFQKCFDPECKGFRSEPQPFPMSLVMTSDAGSRGEGHSNNPDRAPAAPICTSHVTVPATAAPNQIPHRTYLFGSSKGAGPFSPAQ